MKKIIASLYLFFGSYIVFSQSNYPVGGKVIDAATKLPMQAASVFAENTTIGTATAADGTFHLQLPNGGYDLVVTFTGYQTETRRISSADAGNSDIVIEIKQKKKSLNQEKKKKIDFYEKSSIFVANIFLTRLKGNGYGY